MSSSNPTNTDTGGAGMKRKYGDRNNNSNYTSGGSGRPHWILKNPKRGGPGILMTCETGREFKCQREGLEILQHYYEQQQPQPQNQQQQQQTQMPSEGKKTEEASMSLEDELKQLQQEKNGSSQSKEARTFGVFETGCRGTVFVLCTMPDSALIPSIKGQKKPPTTTPLDDDAAKDTNSNSNSNTTKNTGTDDPKEDSTSEPQPSDDPVTTTTTPAPAPAPAVASSLVVVSTPLPSPPWDPVATIRHILSDLHNDTAKGAPASRFVTRMIPVQATCYSSEEEIRLTSRALLERYLLPRLDDDNNDDNNEDDNEDNDEDNNEDDAAMTSWKKNQPKPTTFAISVKRRMCGKTTPKKAELIDIVAQNVLDLHPTCKVDLDQPDVTIVVEICKTLVGISVVPKCPQNFQNFNLVLARTEAASGEADET